jgi:hypothetical protein
MPNLVNNVLRWLFTVSSEMQSAEAISLLLRPRVSSLSTSVSRPVNSFPTQTGWGYRLWATTNLNAWESVGTISGNGSFLQLVHTNGGVGPQRYWRLEIKEGGFALEPAGCRGIL